MMLRHKAMRQQGNRWQLQQQQHGAAAKRSAAPTGRGQQVSSGPTSFKFALRRATLPVRSSATHYHLVHAVALAVTWQQVRWQQVLPAGLVHVPHGQRHKERDLNTRM